MKCENKGLLSLNIRKRFLFFYCVDKKSLHRFEKSCTFLTGFKYFFFLSEEEVFEFLLLPDDLRDRLSLG